MATFFSGVKLGYWNDPANNYYGTLTGDVVRSGNTVSLQNLRLQVWCAWSSSWGTMSFWISVNGSQTNYTSAPTGTYSLNGTSFGVSASQTSANIGWRTSDGESGSFTVNFPSGATAPTGLSVRDITPGSDKITATVSITGWGVGGSDSSKYRELQVWTASASGLIEPRRYKAQYGTSLSGVITCDNTSLTSTTPLIITPNTTYTVGAYATNGAAATGSTRIGNYTTLPAQPLMSVNVTAPTEATINIDAPAQGNSSTITAFYKLDDGEYISAGTIQPSGTLAVNLQGLNAGTTYSVTVKLRNTTGDSLETADTFSTKKAFYTSVEGRAKNTKKIYASVDGQSKQVLKLYCSVDGKTKRLL